MAARPHVVGTVPALRRALKAYGRDTVALVPTMGALHAGHLALVRQAHRRARRVVVSIFVNPAQFTANEDFGTYPRTLKADLAALAAVKADLVWAPSAAVMYPDGFATRIEPGGPAKAGLEDRYRPHLFGGVATVVAKLLLQCRPDVALFGEKDYQQLRMLPQLARDLDLSVKIFGGRTVRETDGLALSSRNVYLAPAERKAAPVLYRTLKTCAAKIAKGAAISDVLAEGRMVIEGAGFTLDYLEARHAKTLEPVSSPQDQPIRLLVAAKIGKARLIDNVAV